MVSSVEGKVKEKVKVRALDIVLLSESSPQKCSGTAHVLKGSHSSTYGIRTFRSPVFLQVPSGNLRFQERKFPGTFVPGIVSSLSDHSKGCWRCSKNKSKKIYSKMNANNITILILLNKAKNFCTPLM